MARRKATEEAWPTSDAQEIALWAIDEVVASVKSGEYPPQGGGRGAIIQSRRS
jgi:hypothetical protein